MAPSYQWSVVISIVGRRDLGAAARRSQREKLSRTLMQAAATTMVKKMIVPSVNCRLRRNRGRRVGGLGREQFAA